MIVAAIWRLNSEYSVKIDSNWTDGLFIIISDCGNRWAGWAPNYFTRDIPRIGESLPENKTISIHEEQFGTWETVRQDLINNRLGPPSEGTNPLLKVIETKKNVCTCDLYIMINNGCPSSNGGICPDAH